MRCKTCGGEILQIGWYYNSYLEKMLMFGHVDRIDNGWTIIKDEHNPIPITENDEFNSLIDLYYDSQDKV